MGDMGDDFRAWDKAKKTKKQKNKDNSTSLLEHHGIEYESKNNGVHLIVSHNDKIADFWPSTGKWAIRPSGNYKRGVFKLIKEFKQ